MKIKGFVIIFVTIALILTGQYLISGVFTAMPPRIEINAKNYDLTASRGITPDDLGCLKDMIYTYEKTGTSQMGYDGVNVTITNENYPLLKEISVIRGSFFSQTACDIGQNMIVISEDLSFSLFKTINSVRFETELDGFSYRVCGVYRRNALLGLFSSDGNETVYIPPNSDFDRTEAQNTALQRICFLNTGDTNAANIVSNLKQITLNVNNYLPLDIANANHIIGQYPRITLFAAGISAIVVIIQVIAKKVMKTYVKKTFTASGRTRLIVDFAQVIILIIAAVIIYQSCKFSVYIPSQYIPSDRILDFTFYKNLLVTNIQRGNIYYAYKAFGYERLYHFESCLNLILTAIGCILTICFFVKLSKLIRRKSHVRDKSARTVQEIS